MCGKSKEKVTVLLQISLLQLQFERPLFMGMKLDECISGKDRLTTYEYFKDPPFFLVSVLITIS